MACRLPRVERMTLARQALGKMGEDFAVDALLERGYAILARRYRTRYGEIDIVADDRGTIVFVEVRARTTSEFGTAAESLTPAKRRKVTAMAVDYLARNHLTNRPCRFDVVAIDDALSPSPTITVYEGAFDAVGPAANC
jgi:putative endonuclease